MKKGAYIGALLGISLGLAAFTIYANVRKKPAPPKKKKLKPVIEVPPLESVSESEYEKAKKQQKLYSEMTQAEKDAFARQLFLLPKIGKI